MDSFEGHKLLLLKVQTSERKLINWVIWLCWLVFFFNNYGVFKLEPTPGKEKEIGIIGFSAIIFGFFTNIIMGFIIDLFQIYKRITIYIFLSVSVCLGVWTILLEIYPSFFLISFSLFIFSHQYKLLCCILYTCSNRYLSRHTRCKQYVTIYDNSVLL